jgi:DNA-binding MarR family transcriptional regulator
MAPPVRWLDEAEERAWRGLITTTYGLLAALDRELQDEHGLSLAEYEVLSVVSESDEQRIRMSDLAAHLHLSPSGLTRRIDALVRRGLVGREPCPEDRRGSYAVLTPDGWDLLRRAAPTHVRGVREHLVDRLTPRQLANVAAAFDAVRSGLESEPRSR